MPFRAACIQFCAGRHVDANVVTVSRLIGEAAEGGADLIMTPEMTGLIESSGRVLLANTFEEADDKALPAFRSLAARLGKWILIGSLAIRVGEDRLANRSFLLAPDGSIAARFDKIPMFDVSLEGGESYRESNRYEAGTQAVVADLPWGRLGMTVCYDVRFPGLYRALARAGADFITVPSAFTVPTGKAHWHVLLRARAIENGCYVFAPAHHGEHESGRKTYGHSLIVDPWGEVIAEAPDGEGVIFADIDAERVKNARNRIPALMHDREFSIVHAPAATHDRKLAS